MATTVCWMASVRRPSTTTAIGYAGSVVLQVSIAGDRLVLRAEQRHRRNLVGHLYGHHAGVEPDPAVLLSVLSATGVLLL